MIVDDSVMLIDIKGIFIGRKYFDYLLLAAIGNIIHQCQKTSKLYQHEKGHAHPSFQYFWISCLLLIR
jgi:hypothetical protein